MVKIVPSKDFLKNFPKKSKKEDFLEIETKRPSFFPKAERS